MIVELQSEADELRDCGVTFAEVPFASARTGGRCDGRVNLMNNISLKTVERDECILLTR